MSDTEERPSETVESLTQSLDEYNAALDKLRALGVRVSAASRLGEVARIVRSVLAETDGNALALVAPERARSALIALREMEEVSRISGALPAAPPKELIDRLGLMVGDPLDPHYGD